MKKHIIYSLIIAATVLGGCSKILNRVDVNGVSDQTLWGNASVAALYLNNLYNIVIPVWPNDWSSATLPTPIHNISDDCNGTANSSSNIIQGTLTVDQITDFYTGTSGAYAKIRQINILLNSIDSGTIDQSTRDIMKAQAYFLRAWCYFELFKCYGGVPYITYPQDWITDSLLVPRNSSSNCVNMMIADLNHCSILPGSWTGSDFGRITRGAACALKGKILLYWASAQFNPSNDASRWEAAYQANQNAYDTLIMDGYALYPTFSRIFLDAAKTGDKEPILWRAFNGASTTSSLYNGYDNVTRPYSQSAGSGGKTNNPTWNLVQAFPMKDGKAITDLTSTYTYDTLLFWHNRDPRFYATIVYNGAVYGLGPTSGRKQWTYNGIADDKSAPTTTGFYCRKNIDTTVAASNTQYGKTYWVEMRMAEIMLNLAECANATNRQSIAYTMLEAIRARAGITKGADGLYGLSATLSTADMQTAIMLERRIELAFEGKRYDDLRRTRTFDQLNNTYRLALITMPDTAMGIKASTLEAKITTGTGVARDTINTEVDSIYARYFKVKVQPISGELPINFLTNYYIYGIPTTNITKDPSMLQTLGWGSGTFDATQ